MANIARTQRGMSPWVDFFNVDNFFDNNFLRKMEKDFPAVNISENSDSFMIEVVAPGFKKEDFKLKVDDDVLTISAESKAEKESGGKQKEYTRREYSYSSFTRSFRLPDNVKDDSIAATYTDGILTLTLPKSKVSEKATREITIN